MDCSPHALKLLQYTHKIYKFSTVQHTYNNKTTWHLDNQHNSNEYTIVKRPASLIGYYVKLGYWLVACDVSQCVHCLIGGLPPETTKIILRHGEKASSSQRIGRPEQVPHPSQTPTHDSEQNAVVQPNSGIWNINYISSISKIISQGIHTSGIYFQWCKYWGTVFGTTSFFR